MYESNSLFTAAKSVFCGHSPKDALLRVTEDRKLALDNDSIVSVMFIDLSKAFNSVDHLLLLAKLFTCW